METFINLWPNNQLMETLKASLSPIGFYMKFLKKEF